MGIQDRYRRRAVAAKSAQVCHRCSATTTTAAAAAAASDVPATGHALEVGIGLTDIDALVRWIAAVRGTKPRREPLCAPAFIYVNAGARRSGMDVRVSAKLAVTVADEPAIAQGERAAGLVATAVGRITSAAPAAIGDTAVLAFVTNYQMRTQDAVDDCHDLVAMNLRLLLGFHWRFLGDVCTHLCSTDVSNWDQEICGWMIAIPSPEQKLSGGRAQRPDACFITRPSNRKIGP